MGFKITLILIFLNSIRWISCSRCQNSLDDVNESEVKMVITGAGKSMKGSRQHIGYDIDSKNPSYFSDIGVYPLYFDLQLGDTLIKKYDCTYFERYTSGKKIKYSIDCKNEKPLFNKTFVKHEYSKD